MNKTLRYVDLRFSVMFVLPTIQMPLCGVHSKEYIVTDNTALTSSQKTLLFTTTNAQRSLVRSVRKIQVNGHISVDREMRATLKLDN
jgi:hypothetical protein